MFKFHTSFAMNYGTLFEYFQMCIESQYCYGQRTSIGRFKQQILYLLQIKSVKLLYNERFRISWK